MLGIGAREIEKKALLYSVRLSCMYIGDILEASVCAMVEELDFEQFGLCSKLYAKVYMSWLSLLVLYSTLLPNVLTFALKTSISYFELISVFCTYSVGYKNPESLVK